MRTRKELISFSIEELRQMANDEGIDTLGRNKMGLISELLIKDKSEPLEVDSTLVEDIPDPIYTDRKGHQIFREETVNCRVGGKWFSGFISRFKKIEDDDYAFVLLEGAEKTKMFHTIDIEKVEVKKSSKLSKSLIDDSVKIIEEPPKLDDSIMPIVLNIKPEIKPKTESKSEVKKDKVVSQKKEIKFNSLGFRSTKHDDKLLGADLCGVKYQDVVKFKVAMTSKKNPGMELTGKVDSLFWDPIAQKAYFIIKVDGDSHIYCKSPNSVNLI